MMLFFSFFFFLSSINLIQNLKNVISIYKWFESSMMNMLFFYFFIDLTYYHDEEQNKKAHLKKEILEKIC